MSELKYEQIAPENGSSPTSMVVLLHGYGANGKDLIEIGKILQSNLPRTLFVSPDAPNKCSMQPEGGYQWFGIPMYDRTSPIEVGRSLTESANLLKGLIETQIENHSIPEKKVFLLGFSQGTMLSLKFALETDKQLGGVVGFSGRLMNPIKDAKDIKSKPPIFLLHDEDDQVVPYYEMKVAYDNLVKFGLKVYTFSSKGAGHSISPLGIGAALHFISREQN